MTPERRKLSEAKYFLKGMTRAGRDYDDFSCEASAFLTSARSTLQYLFERTKKNHALRIWYDQQISSRPVLKFFKDKRDMNIHVQPVTPQKEIRVQVLDNISLHDSVRGELRDLEGKLIQFSDSPPAPPPPVPRPRETEVSCFYRFPDWQGKEDVLELCNRYLAEVEDIVQHAEQSGWL